MNNIDLFSYITKELYSHGGDGSVLVLFKHQDPNIVADEFEKWTLNDYNTTLKRGETARCMFTDMSNECIAFGIATHQDGTKYDQRKPDNALSWQWNQWDTFIITW